MFYSSCTQREPFVDDYWKFGVSALACNMPFCAFNSTDNSQPVIISFDIMRMWLLFKHDECYFLLVRVGLYNYVYYFITEALCLNASAHIFIERKHVTQLHLQDISELYVLLGVF